MQAIVLFSGGLDSILASRILQEQGIEVIGLNFATPFHDDSVHARKKAEQIGIELVVHRTDDEYVRLVAKPRWGYGKAVNPCIDCRIEMCRVARRLMEQRGAGFVATGEIAGQRPNSQMQHQLNLIARESGLDGFLVRPLSAGVLDPTKPEILGWIDRNKLYGYTGRGRGRLIALAHRLGVVGIPQPSTGCFLCEKSYAPRFVDLRKHESAPTNWDAEMLNAGRQIRIDPTLKAVLGRNEDHCNRLATLFEHPDARPSILFVPESFNGTTAVLVTTQAIMDNSEEVLRLIRLGGSLVLRFTNPEKYDPQNAIVRVKYGATETCVSACIDEQVALYRVI